MVDQERLNARAGQDQAAERTSRHDVCDRGLAQDHRNLPEEVATGHPRTLVAVDHDRRLTIKDDVETGPGEALAQDPHPLGVEGFLEDVDDRRELGIGQIGEQREAGNSIHQLLTRDHTGMVPQPDSWRDLARVDGPPSRSAAWPRRPTGGRMTLTREETTQLLARTRLFAGVDAAGLERIAARATELDVPADRVIARQGEIGTGFFIVVSGAVRVVRDGETIARLGPGEFFGELSVLDGRPRIAQVVSSGPTTCLALASWDFEAVVQEQPSLAMAILRELAGRLRELTESQHH